VIDPAAQSLTSGGRGVAEEVAVGQERRWRLFQARDAAPARSPNRANRLMWSAGPIQPRASRQWRPAESGHPPAHNGSGVIRTG
jgi:hypothetical protein